MKIVLFLILFCCKSFSDDLKNPEFSKCLIQVNQKLKKERQIAVSLQRPTLEKYLISKNGKFKIHFDTSKFSGNLPSLVDQAGERIINTEKQFIDSVEYYFNEVIDKELNLFGFSFPPGDGNLGGGSELDIYILDLGNRTFGYTEWDELTPIDGTRQNKRFTTYIVIDNDYGKGFRTKGIEALKTTLAHEFFHTIQIGHYGLWNEFLHYYEMSAESMEPIVFPNTIDYLNDLKDYFQNHNKISLMSSDSRYYGYERALWNIFLNSKFGYNITKLIWSEILNQTPTYAQEKILKTNYSTTTAKEFINFTSENYLQLKNKSSQYYTNISFFPELIVDEKINLASNNLITFSAKNFTSRYFQIISGIDTSLVVAINLNENDMLMNYSNLFQASFLFQPTSIGVYKLSTNSSYNFTVQNKSDWHHSNLFGKNFAVNYSSPFPNPVNLDKSLLTFPLNSIENRNSKVKLIIMSSDLNPIYSEEEEIIDYSGNPYVVWKGNDKFGNKVASGIYFYSVIVDENKSAGKFAVIK
ncbi:MAG: hypothetical protein O3A55_01660 [Bacteroidetes bacterium]|nr:hypothetical protein [Bacteroidota bacterium]